MAGHAGRHRVSADRDLTRIIDCAAPVYISDIDFTESKTILFDSWIGLAGSRGSNYSNEFGQCLQRTWHVDCVRIQHVGRSCF